MPECPHDSSDTRWLAGIPFAAPMASAAGGGFGLIGLAGLLEREGLLDNKACAAEESLNPMAARPGHFRARAKRVIWIFANGGPSQVDTWDFKPALERWHGRSMRNFDASFKDTTGFFKNQVGALDEVPLPVHAPGPVREDGLGDLPAARPARRQDGIPSFGLHRVEQSFPALFMINTGLRAWGSPASALG